MRKLLFILVAAAAQMAFAGQSGISAVRPLAESGDLAGALVLAASRDKIIEFDAVGYADLSAKIPMRKDSMFWIASQTKAMTAAAFMTLVDSNRASLDDPVSKYIPEFADIKVRLKDGTIAKPKNPILIRNLLSHTAGLPFSSSKEKTSLGTLDRFPLSEAVKAYASDQLLSEPGTNYKYSNAGLNTVGRIIEIVSGKPYEEYMRENIFKPLGMKDTTFCPTKEQIARIAKPYRYDKESGRLAEVKISQLTYPLDSETRKPMPAGGLFSTAEDVLAFCRMLENNGVYNEKRILSEKSVKEMTSRQTPEDCYGYGLGLSVGKEHFGHGGAYSTFMEVYPERDLIIIFMWQKSGKYSARGESAISALNRALLNDLKPSKTEGMRTN